jgi:hypothetical protein
VIGALTHATDMPAAVETLNAAMQLLVKTTLFVVHSSIFCML